ncbi:SDR family oxidoreductase [Polyangium sp. 15x6]|uniref:SDR family oxidoreductase n=1 Tax=Polyangium sp. 15x6 TaxID=3042687 RepID=UPI00249C3FD1|nr:SDR family oxidoreductase [Polyangium sp. 15x6]MDI3287544.1 SDR family oxidoreductase [Polyangium sp. 15x6]
MTIPHDPKRILVVGATGRLGVAIAKALVQRGDHVAITARSQERLDALADELSRAPESRPTTVCADLRDPEAPERIASRVLEGGRLDGVILACGPFPHTPLEKLSREDLENTLAVHAVAPLLLVNALSEELTRTEGAVVALVDAGVTRPFPNHVAYLTAKGALQTGLRALAVELAPQVRVNLLAIGIVADPEADADPTRLHRLAARSPLGRFGTPAEVVHGALSLLDATWATGEIWGIGR